MAINKPNIRIKNKNRIEDVIINIDIERLNTGDIILFHGDSYHEWYDQLIENVTHSPYEHAAIVVRDPWFNDFSRNGVYIIQTDSERGIYSKTNCCTIEEALIGRTWVDVRSWINVDYNDDMKQKFTCFWNNVKDKPYNYCPCDWMVSGIHNLYCKCCKLCKTKHDFWCSDLVAYGCVKLEWLPDYTDWSNFSPGDLSRIKVDKPYKLGPIWRLL